MRSILVRIPSIAQIPAILLIAAAAWASPAAAQRHEFALGVGYSELSLDDTAGKLGDQGGFRFEPRFTWQPFEHRPEVRFGVGVSFSYYFDESHVDQIPNQIDIDRYEDLSLITPEFQLSWRQPMSEKWWLEGGVAVGAVFGIYSAGDVVFGDLFDEDLDEDDLGLGLRPFVRAGFRGGDKWTWGVEASYQWTDVDFGAPVGGDVTEWYVGLFIGFGQ